MGQKKVSRLFVSWRMPICMRWHLMRTSWVYNVVVQAELSDTQSSHSDTSEVTGDLDVNNLCKAVTIGKAVQVDPYM